MIGIFGGTFDPIHYGHLRPAREAMTRLALDELRFLPAANPPHRNVPRAPARDRLEMVRLAIHGEPGFAIDDRELVRGGPSYMVLTLESLRAELLDAPLCLLIGADSFSEFHTWHRWREIPRLAHLVVMHRPNVTVSADTASWPEWARPLAAADAGELRQSPAGRVMFVAVSPQSISATDIRARVAAGASIDGLVPGPVASYIAAHGLYRNSTSQSPQELRI